MSLHHAPDLDDGTLAACGNSVGYILSELEQDVTAETVDQFLKEPDACKPCVEEIKAKLEAAAAPPQSNVQTAVLPESDPGGGPDPS